MKVKGSCTSSNLVLINKKKKRKRKKKINRQRQGHAKNKDQMVQKLELLQMDRQTVQIILSPLQSRPGDKKHFSFFPRNIV